MFAPTHYICRRNEIFFLRTPKTIDFRVLDWIDFRHQGKTRYVFNVCTLMTQEAMRKNNTQMRSP